MRSAYYTLSRLRLCRLHTSSPLLLQSILCTFSPCGQPHFAYECLCMCRASRIGLLCHSLQMKVRHLLSLKRVLHCWVTGLVHVSDARSIEVLLQCVLCVLIGQPILAYIKVWFRTCGLCNSWPQQVFTRLLCNKYMNCHTVSTLHVVSRFYYANRNDSLDESLNVFMYTDSKGESGLSVDSRPPAFSPWIELLCKLDDESLDYEQVFTGISFNWWKQSQKLFTMNSNVPLTFCMAFFGGAILFGR